MEREDFECYRDDDKIINGESLNFDMTLEQLSNEIKPGETLILDVGNNYFNQNDELYNSLVLKGYEVRKTFRNGRNQLIVRQNIQQL